MKTIVVTLLSTLFFCSQIFAETETYEINNASGSETDFVYNKYQRQDNSKIIISERKGADGNPRYMDIFWRQNGLKDCIIIASESSKHNDFLSDGDIIQNQLMYDEKHKVFEKRYIAYSPLDKITSEVSIGMYNPGGSENILIIIKNVYKEDKQTSVKFIDAKVNNLQALTLFSYFVMDLPKLTTPR